jgi:hypothetical protein
MSAENLNQETKKRRITENSTLETQDTPSGMRAKNGIFELYQLVTCPSRRMQEKRIHFFHMTNKKQPFANKLCK